MLNLKCCNFANNYLNLKIKVSIQKKVFCIFFNLPTNLNMNLFKYFFFFSMRILHCTYYSVFCYLQIYLYAMTKEWWDPMVQSHCAKNTSCPVRRQSGRKIDQWWWEQQPKSKCTDSGSWNIQGGKIKINKNNNS